MNLENFLKSYEVNLEFFDLDNCLDDIMDISYQIEVLERNFNHLTKTEQNKFIYLNGKLLQLLKQTIPKNELQKRVINKLLYIIKKEKEKNHIQVA